MNHKKLLPLVFGGILVSTAAQAGGLYLYEIGTIDTSFANAGMAARADDASTIYSNPAGMTRLDGNQMSLGLQGLYGDAEYNLDNPNLQEPGNVIGWVPSGHAFYSHSINDRLKVGLGVYGNFGLSLDFDDNWAGSVLVDDATLMALTIQPTAAYAINDQWSIGLGITANYGIFELERKNNSTGASPSTNDYDWAYGARLGVMYELSEATRFGLVWGSEVEYNFDVDISNYPSVPLNTMVLAPQNIMFSGYHRLNNSWAIMGNIGWQDWSKFSDSTVNSQTTALKLEDTWHLAFGGQYTLNPRTKLNAGVSYDTSFYQDSAETSLLMPAGEAWRFGTGVQYHLNEKSDLNFSLEYIIGDEQTSQRPPSGGYDTPDYIVISLQYNYLF